SWQISSGPNIACWMSIMRRAEFELALMGSPSCHARRIISWRTPAPAYVSKRGSLLRRLLRRFRLPAQHGLAGGERFVQAAARGVVGRALEIGGVAGLGALGEA